LQKAWLDLGCEDSIYERAVLYFGGTLTTWWFVDFFSIGRWKRANGYTFYDEAAAITSCKFVTLQNAVILFGVARDGITYRAPCQKFIFVAEMLLFGGCGGERN